MIKMSRQIVVQQASGLHRPTSIACYLSCLSRRVLHGLAKIRGRIATDFVVKVLYFNAYIDKPRDPIGDGYPNKVKQ